MLRTAELRLALFRRARRPGRFGALLAGAALKITPCGAGDVEARLWQRRLRLPAAHHLPYIVGNNPFWSMPLVHCAMALSADRPPPLTVVDVGANVGDSAVLLERYLPGQCKFVCIEPNAEWLPYLKANTSELAVEIIPQFVGEGQLLAVRHGAPGTAGSIVTETGDRSVPLDEVCGNKQVDLIKVDTDGFDFPILRSGRGTLSSRKPALFFEWHPPSWIAQGENPEAIFNWLADYGYKDFCFFADDGFFYCRTSSEQPATIRSLIAAADCRHGVDGLYWDVFAAAPEVCDRAIHNNVIAAQALSTEIRFWHRLQPAYWR